MKILNINIGCVKKTKDHTNEYKNQLINKFNQYCKVLGYPLFDEFEKVINITSVDIYKNVCDEDNIPEWNPYYYFEWYD
jgi:hypothetical protein